MGVRVQEGDGLRLEAFKSGDLHEVRVVVAHPEAVV